jgi:hypothetical protein
MKGIGHKSNSTIKTLGQKGSISSSNFLGLKSHSPTVTSIQSQPVQGVVDVSSNETNSATSRNMPVGISPLEKRR